MGLLLTLELAAWQVPVSLVERHRLPLPFPRGRAISTRSMEILHQLGLEHEVTEIGLPRTETARAAGSERPAHPRPSGGAAYRRLTPGLVR
ncbi:MAG: FAD-dependent monooxygenase [Actinomycetota bacterium]|nr:FAD-dependent monooxygenase [Actinomycetota bacterium]